MKALLVILTAILATQAKADFLNLPVNCRHVRGLNHSNTEGVTVDIRQPGDSPIVALVRDNGDVSRMLCQHLTTGSGLIECHGVWTSDRSPSHLTATMGTFVPFITVVRSEGLFQGAKDTGICIEGNN